MRVKRIDGPGYGPDRRQAKMLDIEIGERLAERPRLEVQDGGESLLPSVAGRAGRVGNYVATSGEFLVAAVTDRTP